jgi:5-hydroxyisourate hydrolase-like protein (transthyretin family)
MRKGQLATSICSRTAPVEEAEEDLAFLRPLASKGPEGRIFGYVTATRPDSLEKYTGEGAITEAAVWLESNGRKLKTVTDSKGEYEFAGLMPGAYRLWAEIPGKLGGGEVHAVVLSKQACVFEWFYARERGSISGLIRDAAGRPVKDIRIEVLRAADQKAAAIQDGVTGEDGRYRIEEVPEGEYLLGVHLRHPPQNAGSRLHRYERNYYPGVSHVETAEPVRVESAQAVGAGDWQIGHPLEPRSIRGVVLGPDDEPAYSVSVELKADGYEDNAAEAPTRPDGTFSLKGLTGIQYFVQASLNLNEGAAPWHCHRVQVSGGDEPLTIKLDLPGKDCDVCRKRH